MAWFASKVNLSTIVSQGLEHVHKLKDDVEKQFDDAVSNGKPAPRASPLRSTAMTPPLHPAPAPSPPRSNPTSAQHEATTANDFAKSSIPTPPRSSDGNKKPLNFFSEWNLGPPSHHENVNFPSVKSAAPVAQVSPVRPETCSPPTPPLTGKREDDMSSEDATNAAALDYIKAHSMPIQVASVTLPPTTSDEKPPEDDSSLSIGSSVSTVLTDVDERPSSTSSLAPSSTEDSAAMEALQAELAKTQALLTERENQLLSASAKMTKLMEELDAAKSVASSDAVVAQLQHALHEKEEQLSQLLNEGQALSIKQGQYEARLRTLRKENNDLLDEHAQTVAALETTQAKWETARSHLMQAEDERKATHAKLQQLQAHSDELRATLAALETANARVQELETQQAQWAADKVALEASQSAVADNGMLESTLVEMQKRVAAVERDAARREELSRSEIASWKKRYQDTVLRMDTLAEETTGATQPLLRQLSQLQQEHQQRELFWRTFQQSADVQLQTSTLNCRNLEAQLASEVATRRGLEEHIETWQSQIHAVQQQLEQASARITTLEDDEAAHLEELTQLKSYISTLEAEKAAATTSSSNDTNAVVAALTADLARAKAQESTYLARVRELEQQVADRSRPSYRERKSSAELLVSERASATTGDVSLIEWHQLQQKVRLRESEAALLKQQVDELEAVKASSSQAMATLQQQNAALEAAAAELASTKAALEAVTVRQNVLLELLGEKEEQLDELETEFRECKQLYQRQIDTLTRDRV
ncbi:hypothetical protein SPRG_05872 [Saprolegnia parasitica CBS 223.65]|uniref:TATA element modulatory factor 1 TATA binding domain-containing protein n=1 Tax=Saprolegnia parasitica (strain CBS 223.65) TaxID=695850 RepID=A0A067CS38_SAPPC|nr:hypothetical protein SPRG_05872 [Saprolegnia parasitica CBS 223.65]KDO29336.1 hypothetical protein SPRG_05872 [Saprolegnia parasitica CBS 223.65]|eukprot:XP_012199839.1 hypothetical protein SPRG_05872 [Saprolegnia parasitica CBS 223.65]